MHVSESVGMCICMCAYVSAHVRIHSSMSKLSIINVYASQHVQIVYY